MGVYLIFDDYSQECKVRAVINGKNWLMQYSFAALNTSASTTLTQDNLPLVIGMYTLRCRGEGTEPGTYK